MSDCMHTYDGQCSGGHSCERSGRRCKGFNQPNAEASVAKTERAARNPKFKDFIGKYGSYMGGIEELVAEFQRFLADESGYTPPAPPKTESRERQEAAKRDRADRVRGASRYELRVAGLVGRGMKRGLAIAKCQREHADEFEEFIRKGGTTNYSI